MSIKVKRNGAWVEVYGGANNEEGIGTKNFVIPIEHSLDNDSNDVYTLGETYSYSDLIAAIDDGNEISCRITSKQSRAVILLPLIEYNMRADHFKFSGLYNEQLITVTITNINDDVLVEYINPNVNADWNQNDATQPDYINNRTHYDAGIADFTPSGSWTLSSSVTGLPSGMATGCLAGGFEVESDKIVPISYDIGPMFGLNRTNVRIGEVIHNTTGPAFDFCVNATYTGGGQWKLYFYTSGGTLYGNTPTISNIKIGVQLDKKYLPMNDIVSEVKNATGVLPVESGGTGYSSITDTKYTIPRYRASSLHSSETTPTTNGVICWTYE